jgi:hypothetical protein
VTGDLSPFRFRQLPWCRIFTILTTGDRAITLFLIAGRSKCFAVTWVTDFVCNVDYWRVGLLWRKFVSRASWVGTNSRKFAVKLKKSASSID